MPIDMQTEQLLTLTEATKILPRHNGKRVAISTLWRWCREGLRGVHLDYVRIGRRISTSREALNRFFNALAEADESPPPYRYAERKPRPPTPRARQRAIEEADRILAESGICPATSSS